MTKQNVSGESDFWMEFCSVLKWHNRESHCCIDTLNRLWRKHPFVRDHEALPTIQRSDLRVHEERWPLNRLWPLLHPDKRTDKVPASRDKPVVVLHWNGNDYLMDGRKRLCAWHRENQCGPHRVLVVSAATSDEI